MAYTFTLEPHPLADLPGHKGHSLMRFTHPQSWRCLTEEERFALCIGGRHSPRFNTLGTVCYALSAAQARDMCALIDGGFSPYPLGFECRSSNDAERSFWRPDQPGRAFTRAEALDSLNLPKRCNRTAEMDLSAPITVCAEASPTEEIALSPVPRNGNSLANRITREEWRQVWREARTSGAKGKALYDPLHAKFSRNQACLLYSAIERARGPDWPSREDRQRFVLNCFGAHNPYSAPAMESPRFEGWRRTVARINALVARLETAGRIERDAGGYVARVLPKGDIFEHFELPIAA